MGAEPEGTWTAARVERLVKLWNDGLSAGQIARDFRFTRNQVIAKINRLRAKGVVLRAKSTVTVRPHRSRPALPERAASPKAPSLPARPFVVVDDPGFIEPVDPTALSATPEEDRPVHFCRWPIGDPLSQSFGYCGREQAVMENGRRASYCQPHIDAERARAAKGRKPTPPADLLRSLRRHL